MIRIVTSRFVSKASPLAPVKEMTLGNDVNIRSGFQSDPNICSFWFAVAMGGLVQGWPVEAVRVRQQKYDLNSFCQPDKCVFGKVCCFTPNTSCLGCSTRIME